MKNFFDFFVNVFGFNDIYEFGNSLIHTKLLFLTIPLSFMSFGVISLYFGFTPLVFISFVILCILEIITGIWASKIKSGKLSVESKKMSRFGLKIFVYLSLMFIINSFAQSYNTEGFRNQLMFLFFDSIHIIMVTWICLEYSISVLENLAVITGKSNSKLIAFIKRKRDSILDSDLLDSKSTDDKKDVPEDPSEEPKV